MKWRVTLLAYGVAVLAVALVVNIGLMLDAGMLSPLSLIALFPALAALVFLVSILPFLAIRLWAARHGSEGYAHAMGAGAVLGVLGYGGVVGLMSMGEAREEPLWFLLHLGAGLGLGLIGGFVFLWVERWIGSLYDR